MEEGAGCDPVAHAWIFVLLDPDRLWDSGESLCPKAWPCSHVSSCLLLPDASNICLYCDAFSLPGVHLSPAGQALG